MSEHIELGTMSRQLATLVESEQYDKAFAVWLSLGMKLAANRGLYVGIKIEPARKPGAS